MILRTRQLRIDYQRTFESPEGKRVLADLKKHCPLFANGLNVGGGIDTNAVLVLEGQANVLKHIYKMLRSDPNEEPPEKALNLSNSGTGE